MGDVAGVALRWALGIPLAGMLARSLSGRRKAGAASRDGRPSRARVCVRSLEEEFGLPSKLAAMSNALKSLPNDRLRYQQLMALASKLPKMDPELKTPERKVPGCLSTVHVLASLQSDGTIKWQGDSDALISKGLVALLVNGLSDCTVEQICNVQPEFIKASGITASLTPGRNNGFFNMFKLMMQQARALSEAGASAAAAAAKGGAAAGDAAGSSEEAPVPAESKEWRLPELRIHNTMARAKEQLAPLKPGVVNMYVCGVTVYDLCHLGHARIMVFFDVVARYLGQRGYTVNYVRNVTDIDDKIIRRAAEGGESAEALARRMEVEMQKDAAALGCAKPTCEPRVSETMPEILSMVKSLEEGQHAYVGAAIESQGSGGLDVYFRVRSFSNYGRLSRCSLDGNQAGARVEIGGGKEAPEDFALWKAAKAGEPCWESPWGAGRPGWHIECSAMAKKHLGDTLDIHGGGPDLLFPHHENEIAQSEAANGKPYAKLWMHCAAVRSSTGDEKMSKSLGNFVTIRKALQSYSGEAIRFYFLSSQYRQPLLYSEEALAQAQERLLKLYTSLRGVPLPLLPVGGGAAADTEVAAPEAWQRFHEAMSNDFDTVSAIAALNELSRQLLQLRQAAEACSVASAAAADLVPRIAAQLRAMGGSLGVLQRDPEEVLRGGAAADQEFEARIDGLVAERTAARKAKDWTRADAAKAELTELGVVLEDGANGTTWRVGALVS